MEKAKINTHTHTHTNTQQTLRKINRSDRSIDQKQNEKE